LTDRFEAARQRQVQLQTQTKDRYTRRESIALFLGTLKRVPGLLSEFDEGLWNALVKTVMVNCDRELGFRETLKKASGASHMV
jgi:hypothetical protein